MKGKKKKKKQRFLKNAGLSSLEKRRGVKKTGLADSTVDGNIFTPLFVAPPSTSPLLSRAETPFRDAPPLSTSCELDGHALCLL